MNSTGTHKKQTNFKQADFRLGFFRRKSVVLKLVDEIGKKKFELIAKLPFSGGFAPFAFRRSPKFDEIDSRSQFHQTLANGEMRKVQSRRQMTASQLAKKN